MAMLCACAALAKERSDRVEGWTYTPGSLTFHFKDSKGRVFLDGTFAGFCLSGERPKFSLFNGNYPSVDKLMVKVGARSWTIDVLQGDHGRYVYIEDSAANDAIAKAKVPIELSAKGGWKLTLKPGPLLARLSRDCAATAPARKSPN